MTDKIDRFQSKKSGLTTGLFLFTDEIELYMNVNAAILPSVIL